MNRKMILSFAVLLSVMLVMGCDNNGGSNKAPHASLTLEPSEAWIYDNATSTANPEITLNASASNDPDGKIANYHYEFGDGNKTDLSDNSTTHTYENGGYYTTSLTVSDNDGADDSTTQPLTINYQYYRGNQPLSATGENSRDHPFPVSGLYPDSGTVEVDASSDFGSSNVNVTVYNSTGEVVKNKKEENLQDNATIEISLSKADFTEYGYGEWKVTVECENGNIHYDITVKVMYAK